MSDYNSLISSYTNGEYTFDELSSATANGLVEETKLTQLLRLMITDVVRDLRYKNKFAQFKKERSYTGKLINNVYVNPKTGETMTIDGVSELLNVAPSDVKSAIVKHTKPLTYPVTYSKDELMKAFSNIYELEAFINKLIDSLYNGSEIDDEEEFLNLFRDMIKNNYVVCTQPTSVTGDNAKDLGICLKKIVADLQKPSDKYNVWKRLNPRDTSAKFWSNPANINIILPNSIWATLDVALYATLFNVKEADLEARVFHEPDENLPEHVIAIVFDSRVVDIREIYAELEPTFYDHSKRRVTDRYNTNNEYGICPFANCVVVFDDDANYPSVSAEAVRNQTVNVTSGVKKTVILEVLPLGANSTLTPTSAGITATTTTCTIKYDPLTGYTADITSTADDSITFSGGVTGTITVDVA